VFASRSRRVQCSGLSVVSHRAQEASRVGSDGLGCRMLWSQGTFVDGKGALIQGLGLLVLALVLVEPRQIVEAGGRVGVLCSYLLLCDREGALVQGLGLLVLALVFIQESQIVEADRRVGMIGSQLMPYRILCNGTEQKSRKLDLDWL
jgi:hypothetical protein